MGRGHQRGAALWLSAAVGDGGEPGPGGDKREVPPAWHKIAPDILGTNPTDLAKPLQNHRGTSGLGDLEAFSQL